MRTARPPPLQNPSRSAHGGLRVHRRLVQPPSPPFRPRLSFTDQLRKDPANRKPNRKPNTVHRNGVAPISVTTNPTAQWIAGLVTDAFPWDEAPSHLIRDRDGVFGPAYTHRIRSMRIRDHPTA